MASRPPKTRVRTDADGVRTVELSRTRWIGWLVAAAIAVPIAATLVAIVLIRLAPAGGARDTAGPDAAPPPAEPRRAAVDTGDARPELKAVAAPAVAREQIVPRKLERPTPQAAQGRAQGAPTPSDEDHESIDARDAIPALIAAGETGGITVFPLPGTKPIKRGILVPEDFPLPEGYVRHYQATDDGKRVPAILMFHPDYEFFDAQGRPVTVPPDRVVPPEMAPPGLEVRMLEVPDARAAGAAGAP